MGLIMDLIIASIILISASQCIEYGFQIDINGDGYLYEQSNLNPVKDHISAYGGQNYDKFYVDNNQRKLLISHYNLTKPSKESKYRNSSSIYSISSTYPGGLTHFAQMNSSKSIFSESTVDCTAKLMTTKYQLSGDGGLCEGVIDTNSRRHPNYLAETSALGQIRMLSRIKNNVTTVAETDASRLLENLESVNITSENGKIDLDLQKRKTDYFLDGEKAFTVTEGSKTQINKETEVDTASTVSLASENDKKLDQLKKREVSIYKEYNGDLISWPIEIKGGYLDVNVMSQPRSGRFGEEVNFTITVRNFGDTRFDWVSLSNKLPPEMKFINSTDDGAFSNGYINWSDAGSLRPLEEKTFIFWVQVNKQVSHPYDLNDTVLAEGESPDGSRDSDLAWVNFTVEAPQITETINDEAQSEFLNKITEKESTIISYPPDESAPSRENDQNVSLLGPINEQEALTNSTINQRMHVLSAPEIDINFTSNATTVNNAQNVNFKVVLEPIGPAPIQNVTLEIQLDPGMELVSPKALNVSNGTIWPKINSLEKKWEKNFVARIRDSNANGDILSVIATVKSEGQVINIGSLELEFRYLNIISVDEDTIISQQPERIPPREPLYRDSYQLGKKLYWDRGSWVGWMQPRPDKIVYFIVDEPSEENAKKTLVIGSVNNNG